MNTKCILLVEDEAAVRLELRELLEDEGYVVREAANGLQALATLNSGFKPSVVLLDMLMPQMDGYEFLNKLQERGEHPPVVLATGADVDHIARSIPRVRKPYCLEPLLSLLRQRCAITAGVQDDLEG